MDNPTTPRRMRRGALVGLALCLALAPLAIATHVVPDFVEGPTNHTCLDFALEGAVWLELKVDPAEDGTYTQGDLTVTIDVDEDGKTLDWTAEGALVLAVFLKAGSAGHHLYVYEGGATADTGLTTPGAGDSNQISHVSFCFVELPEEPTCEDMPEMPECQPPTCEDAPEMPECQPPTCEDMPEMPECPPEESPPTCTEQPEMPECPPEESPPTCTEQPELPECPPQTSPPCPITVTAVANAGETVTVRVDAVGAFDLYRQEGDGEPVLIGQFEGDVEYEDTETRAGSAYTYIAMVGDEVCDEVTVTAIPVFPSALAALAAAALGIVGYAVVARRK